MSKRGTSGGMGSLDKLGILVVVILVVVVGVVVITPKQRMDRALGTVEDYVTPDRPHEARELELPTDEEPDAPEQPRWVDEDESDERQANIEDDDTPVEPEPVKPPEPAPKPVEPVQPAPRPTPAAARTVTVEAGDSLYAIAKRVLGDGEQWRRIAKANPDVDPNALSVGTVLVIPSAVDASPRSATVPTPRTPPAPSGQRIYTVQAGDTLSTISAKVYSTSTRWREIQRANRDQLGDSDRVLVDMKLVIPKLGTSSTRSSTQANTAPAPAASGRTYEVRKGDNLWKIAERMLNDGARWKEIRDLNRDRLRGDDIQVGQVLALPAR